MDSGTEILGFKLEWEVKLSCSERRETRRFNLPLLEKRISAMNPRVLDSNAWILGFENKTFGFGDTNTYAHT